MKYCKYCGKQIPDEASTCPFCGEKLSKPLLGKKDKKWLIILCIALVMVIVLAIAVSSRKKRCGVHGCRNECVEGGLYCYEHTCIAPGCDFRKEDGSEYCSYHELLIEQGVYGNGGSLYSGNLDISNVKTENTSYRTICTGTLTNNGASTVTFVKIKGAFTDYSGDVIDTDWTYAVGTEGLAPGESCKWELSVDLDLSIHGCDVSILDYSD